MAGPSNQFSDKQKKHKLRHTTSSKMSQARPLDGKVAIVTGASRGIGAAICGSLASKGAHLIMNYTSESSEQRTTELASTLSSQYSIKAFAVRADIGSEQAGSTIVGAAQQHFPNETISVIVNNAGVAGNQYIADASVEQFHRQYAVNVMGPLLLMQAALPHLPYDRSARIVNVSSVSSSAGLPGQSIYGGTKAALEAMTRTWARELGERGNVNAVNPGPVETDMYGGVDKDFEKIMVGWLQNTPGSQVSKERDGEDIYNRFAAKGGRPASVDEIAGVVSMLCSPESGWCTGSVICANGGMKMSL